MTEKFVPYRKWLHQHDEEIRKEYADSQTADLSGKMGVHYRTVIRRARKVDVRKSETFIRKKLQEERAVAPVRDKMQAEEYLMAHYHNTCNEELARHLHMDVRTVRRWARRLKLEKSEEFMTFSRQNRRKGYYTSEYLEWRRKRISEVYPEGTTKQLKELCRELGISFSTVKSLASNMKIRRKRFHNQMDLEEFAAYFAVHTNKECGDHFGISAIYASRIAHEYGIKKDKEYNYRERLKRVEKARQTRLEKKKCG